MYEAGFAGAKHDPAAKQELLDYVRTKSGVVSATDVCHQYGLTESGKGKLILPYLHVGTLFPHSMPGPAQERGDCVSHSTKNAALITVACEIASGLPDAKTGKVEGVPEIPTEGILNGVLSTEWFYWWRGYNGDGWMCGTACKVALQHGMMLRKKYDGLDLDLTDYSGRLAGRYGSKSPPAEFDALGKEHLIDTATEIDSHEAERDLLANGHGVTTCGSEGWSSKRDENGVSKRQGSWAHAMVDAGYDDRDEIKSIYGEPLVLIGNSWNKWNSGPRDIYNSAQYVPPHMKSLWVSLDLVNPATGNLMIPHGYFWTTVSSTSRRDKYAFAGARGWARKQLPNYLTGVL